MKKSLHYILVLILLLGVKNASAQQSSDATLKSIVLSTATNLVFATGPSDFNYTTSVSPGTATLTVEPTTNDANAKVTVNGTLVPSGSSSGQITLNGIVTTTINLVVTAQDGTVLTYSIVVSETGSNNAFLDALTVSTGNNLIVSQTGTGNYNYTTTVSPTVNSLAVIPTTADQTATVAVNGVAVTSGSASGQIALPTATTVINVVVTAQDGTTQLTYSITVSKTGSNTSTLSSIVLNPNTALVTTTGASDFNYTTAVNAAVGSITVTPTATDPTATIKVNNVVVASGAASGAITLNAAPATTTINIVVTAQDGTTISTYTITVSRNGSSNANYSSIILNTTSNYTMIASAGPANVNFATSLSAGTTSLTVTPTAVDPNATITVNGVAVANGGTSGMITLAVSPATTTINILITSQDATQTQSIQIIVSTGGSNDADINNIVLTSNTTPVSPYQLTVTSSTPTLVKYSASLSVGVTSVTVTPTAVDANATLTVNGVAVASGGTSAGIAVPSVITIVVTAQSGFQKTYQITVTTSGSSNANATIALTPNPASAYQLTVTGTTATTVSYSTSLSVGTTSTTVTPTGVDANATITVNGVAVINGQPSTAIALNAAPATTTITIVVTAQDTKTTKTYTIVVSIKGSNNAGFNYVLSNNVVPTQGTSSGINTNWSATVSPHTIGLTITVNASDPNVKSITVNGLAVVSGSASNTITLNNTGTTIVSIVVTAQDGTTKKSATLTISRTGSLIVWTGAATVLNGAPSLTDWKNTGNWNPAQVPGAGDVASFGETAYSGNVPTISNNTNVGEVYFGSATPTTLTITTNNKKLTIGTNLTINQDAVAKFSAGSASSGVDIAPGATVNFAGTGNGTLTISTVIFTLKSNAAGSASVGQITTGSITGSVNVERYIQGGTGYRGYRMLSSSVATGAATGIYSLNYVTNSCFVTGTTGVTGGFDATGNPSLFLYRESIAPSNATFTSGNFRGINNIKTPPTYTMDFDGPGFNIPVGTGFQFFFRGDKKIATLAAETTAAYVPTNTILTETGTLNQGQIIVKNWFTGATGLSYTVVAGNASIRGFNLVGNPYASSIDWDKYNTTTTNSGIYTSNVGNTIYILDPVSKNYGVYIANSAFGGTNNATHIIPSGQGFFVQASAAGAALYFNEDAKTTTQVTGANLLLGTPVANNTIGRYLHVQLNKDSTEADEIYISFNSSAKSQFVIGEDAVQKPGFGAASLASMSSDGVPLSINTLALPGQSEAIALNVNATVDGSYQLSVPEIKSIPALYDVWLMDAYKKDSVDVRQSPIYNFTINKSDPASYGSNRFSLVIRQNPALGLHLLNFAAAKATNGAQIVWKTINEQNYTNFTVERSTNNGTTFEQLGGFVSNADGTYSFLDKNPQIALNQYRLKIEDLNGAITYSKIVPLLYSTLSDNMVKNSINVYPNPTRGMVNLAINQNSSSSASSTLDALQGLSSTPVLVNSHTESTQSYDIKIFSITGNLVKTAVSSSPSWQGNLSILLPGTYIIQVLNSSDKSVVGKSTFVKL